MSEGIKLYIVQVADAMDKTLNVASYFVVLILLVTIIRETKFDLRLLYIIVAMIVFPSKQVVEKLLGVN